VVLDLDGSDTASVFYPWQGTTPAAIARGASVLPGSVALDAQPGPGWLVAVGSKKPFEVKKLDGKIAERVKGLVDASTLPRMLEG